MVVVTVYKVRFRVEEMSDDDRGEKGKRMNSRLWNYAFAVALAAVSAAPISAQDPPGAPGIRFGGGSIMLGGMEGPKIRQLIRRPDVQRGLGLDLNQQNAIEAIFKNPEAGRVAIRLEATGDTNPDDLKRQAEEQVRKQMGGLEEQVKKVLKPQQWDRFVELDLQWRGPLALSEARVAERLKIDPSHRTEIGKAAASYNSEKQQVMMKLTERNDDGSGRVSMRFNSKALDNPQTPEVKQLKKAKDAADKKILDILSSEERARWTEAKGEPFTFRTDIPGNRF